MENLTNIDNKASIYVGSDLRKHLPDPLSLAYGNNSSFIIVNVDGHFSTIGQMRNEFRKSINDKLKKKIDLVFDKSLGPGDKNTPMISSIGPHYFKRPIVDFATGPMGTKFMSDIFLVLGCFGKFSETMSKINLTIGHGPDLFDSHENDALVEKVMYCLTNFDRNTTITEALKELKQFQPHRL